MRLESVEDRHFLHRFDLLPVLEDVTTDTKILRESYLISIFGNEVNILVHSTINKLEIGLLLIYFVEKEGITPVFVSEVGSPNRNTFS